VELKRLKAELGSVAWGAWARAPRIMRGGHGAGTVVTAVVLLLSLQHPSHSTAAQVLHHTLLPSIRDISSSIELTESRQMTPASLASYARTGN
jgi:hypothetical protein